MSTVSAKHILVTTLEEAQNLKNQISNENDFSAKAQEHSQCPSGKSGGDLGTFGKGLMVESFENAAFGLDVGTISEPVQTQFGYHLILRTG